MPCCEKCIIPDSFPGVTLENGLCTFCRNNESSGKVRSNRDRSQALSRILRTGRRNRPSGYDYLVPVRGDRESCYALYYVARNLKLNPLAVFFDSGFTTHCARRNVELVCRKLGVSWTIASPPSRYRRRAVIETLRLSRLTGHYLSLCRNCENNLRTVAVNEAALRKIPYILWSSTGHSGCIENQDNPAAGQETVDTPVIQNSSSRFLCLIRMIRMLLLKGGLYHQLQYHGCVIMDNFASKAPGGFKRLNPFYQVPLTGETIRVVHFYRYVHHDPALRETTLKTELGWQPQDKQGNNAVCRLRCIENYASVRATGLSLDGIANAALVRKGLMTRAEALQHETALRKTLEQDCLQTLHFLGFDNYPLAFLPGWQETGLASRFHSSG